MISQGIFRLFAVRTLLHVTVRETISEILGCRGVVLLALSLFISGTLSCGIAASMSALIAARAIAGMGGDGWVPQPHVIRCWP